MAICNNRKCSLGECDQAETCAAYIPVMTNADRIREMSDEELANMLTDFSNNGGWVAETGREICYERHIDWLKQPAEGD